MISRSLQKLAGLYFSMRQTIAVLVLLAALATMAPCLAIPVPSLSYPELLDRADLVLAGRVLSVSDEGVGVTDSPGMPKAELMRASLKPEDVIKGTMPADTVKIEFYRNTAAPGADLMPAAEIPDGKRVLVFLKAKEGGGYSPLLANNIPPPVLEIGEAVTPDGGATPLRKLMLLMAAGTRSASPSVRIECLSRLQDFGFLLYPNPESAVGKAAQRIRSDLHEPGGLEECVSQKILPLLPSSNAVVSQEAQQGVITRAALQDPAAVPMIARVIQTGDPRLTVTGASTLRSYRNPASVAKIVLLLDSSTTSIRESVAYSLREMGDPAAIPALVRHLDEKDFMTQYFLVTALSTATKSDQYPDIDTFQAERSRYVKQWKQWALSHPDSIQVNKHRP